MKVYKIEVMVIDLDEIGEEEIKDVIEHTKYPNRCIHPEVIQIESRDVGKWTDDHLLNHVSKSAAEFKRLFSQ